MKYLVTTSAPQTYFTARELAEISKKKGLTCFPQAERGARDYASRNGWNDLGQNLARKRAGKVGGGGMEYHISLMPEPLRMAYEGSLITAGLKTRLEAEHSADDRRISALKASTLPARARKVMEARAEILKAIEGYAISQGMGRAWGVAQFLDAQAAMMARQEIEARRDCGEILTDREIAALARPLLLTTGFMIDPERIVVANDRRGKPSVGRSAIYDWFKTRDEKGVVALAPAATKEEAPIPPAFADFLRHYAKPSKPSIADAYAQYFKEAAAKDGVQMMTLTQSQVEYILRVRMNNIEKNVGREGMLTLRSRLQFQEFLRTTLMTEAAKQGVGISAVPITPSTDKNLRIERLQPPVAAGLIRFSTSHRTLIDQLQQWPNGDHDDGPDALDMLWQNTLHFAGKGGAGGEMLTASTPTGGDRLGGYRLGGR